MTNAKVQMPNQCQNDKAQISNLKTYLPQSSVLTFGIHLKFGF
jgi:hypothetical protein